MKTKNEKGEEIEVFTPEEVNARVEAEKTAATQAAQAAAESSQKEMQQKLEDAQAEKAKLEADLAAASGDGGDTKNFATLKAALDKKDTEIKELRDMTTKEKDLRMQDIKTDLLGRYARGNEEMQKKILFHFENTLKGVNAQSKEELQAKMESAFKLSVDTKSPDVVSAANYGGGGPGSSYIPDSGAEKFTAGQKQLGAKLGISEDDFKKYGPKVK